MSTHRALARPPREPVVRPRAIEDPDELTTYLTDASRYPGGATPRLYRPTSEGEVAWVVRHEPRVLAIGAQSSLTGGGAPRGEALLATAGLDAIGPLAGDRVRVGAGVPLITLQQVLSEQGAFYPPAPTFLGAFVGGTVSTNAAGAATWKYGTTRDWVEALTVVLATGDVLEVRRGEVVAGPVGGGEGFELELPSGEVLRVPVPGYRMPDVPKRSAGYHAEPGMDLVDLFVGAEGTLGVVTEVELRVLTSAPPLLIALAPLRDEARGLELVGRLREASRRTWASGERAGLDVRAIESMDRRCLELLRADGEDRRCGVTLPEDAQLLLLIQLELPAELDAAAALEAYALGESLGELGDTPIARLLELLAEFEAQDDCELALPGDQARAEQLLALREAVPMCVNHRVRDAQRDVDPGIQKVAADMIVPFERFAEALAAYRAELGGRGLDVAIWGHVSDGNVHPNVIPRARADVERGYEGILACGRAVARLGGCPLSEHGTGRNPVKQALLRDLYGEEGLAAMRAVKRALDPTWKLAPGVLFPAE